MSIAFAAPVSPWIAFAAALVVVALLVFAWRRSAGLTTRQRAALVALRGLALVLLGVCLLRPVAIVPSTRVSDAVVPILVDASRSMRLADAGSPDARATRFDAAKSVVADKLLPVLDPSFVVEVLAFGDTVGPYTPGRTIPDGRASDLRGVLADVRERYRGQRIAGIVLVSDGAETSSGPPAAQGETVPVFTVGVGQATPPRDREVLSVTAGEATLTDSVVDLTASVAARGFGGAPVELRVLENGRAVHVRRVSPPDDGTPLRAQFRVSPRQDAASVYVVELQASEGELTTENNRASVLVRPPGRPRRILLVEGAPGFEHSFIKRAWQQDRGLEIDSIVRKGRNERDEETYYVQANPSRAKALAAGYPTTRVELFAYDAIVLANVEADLLTREQLGLTIDFVAERGGGLLMLGSRSLASAGLMKTPLEELMPVEFSDRVGRAALGGSGAARLNRVALTAEGQRHPVMQLGAAAEDSAAQWAEMPPLGSTTALGAGKPGASVLAVTVGAGGNPRPLVAVQRYGHGRSMVFAGEASWRWRMMLPSSNRTFERFWRQSGRWLAVQAPDPVSVSATSVPVGSRTDIVVDVRDPAFRPISDATVRLRVTTPSGGTSEPALVPDTTVAGRFVGRWPAEQAGLVRLDVEARRGPELVGLARDWALVGGSDRELADPRRNDEVLDRLARETGGARVEPANATRLRDLLAAAAAAGAHPPEERELWHSTPVFLVLLALLVLEWALRRRWGLR
jgi:uncharacterized membrane protein